MDKNKLFLKKSLGQHFLTDQNIIRKIINSCNNLQNMNVIEVGPGNGALTNYLLKECNHLTSIEKDSRLEINLKEIKQNNTNFSYIIADAKNVNLSTLVNKPKAIIANLPYNVGTFLFTNWLQISNEFSYFVLMFQKEVAERITAKVNEKHYGRLALFTQLYGKAELLFKVSKNCFNPAPLVESAVIKFVPNNEYLNVNKKLFTEITKTAFSTRRKTIKSSLKKYNFNFEEISINSKLRPENLTFEEFVLLSKYCTNK